MSHIADFINYLRMSLFPPDERNRLHDLSSHLHERDTETHEDFLNKHLMHDEHQIRVEHHATEFWHHYYNGEHPQGVLKDEAIGEHEYGTEQQHIDLKERMLKPEFVDYDLGTPAQAINIEQRLVSYLRLGDMALAQNDYKDAESNFQSAVKLAEHFGPTDFRLIQSLKKLAYTLSKYERYESAETVLERLRSIDQSIAEREHENR